MEQPTVKTRRANNDDSSGLMSLYKEVARTVGGIARQQDEITPEYIEKILSSSQKNGLMFVAHGEEDAKTLWGSVHAWKPEVKAFSHILSDLTIVVHPDHQGKGIGRKLFTVFLEEIKTAKRDVWRVELTVRESNLRGILLYETLGFVREGRLENRIRSVTGGYEADVSMAWFNPSFHP